MNDLVNRLRNQAAAFRKQNCPGFLEDEAADEIERLGTNTVRNSQDLLIRALNGEIIGLKERLDALLKQRDELLSTIEAYARDIEKAVAESVKAGIGEHSPEAAIATLRFQRDELLKQLKAGLQIANSASMAAT